MHGRSELTADRAQAALLGAYGVYAIILGAGTYLIAGPWVFGGPPLAESNFVGHLSQSHASTVVGLGCIALGVRKVRGPVRLVSFAICVGSLLGAMLYMFATPTAERGPFSLFMVVSQFFWAAGFGYLLQRGASDPQDMGPRPLRGGARFVLVSFCVLVTFSGLIWLLTPVKFATAAAGALAGPAAVFAGQIRGVADVAIGLAGWAALCRTASQKPILIGVLIANVLLVIAGGLAQSSALYNPARWVVEGLHVLWSAGLLAILMRKSQT